MNKIEKKIMAVKVQGMTAEEKQIIKYLSNGLTAPEIAAEMESNLRTLERKILTLKKVFGGKTLTHLISIFFRNKALK